MSTLKLVPLDGQPAEPLRITPRLRSQLVYFIQSSSQPDAPSPNAHLYTFDPDEVSRWLDEGVIALVSPLDTANHTEVELSEEQETLLTWLSRHAIRHVRLEE